MKNFCSLILLMLLITLIGCAGMQQVPASELEFQRVVEVPGFSKDKIYNATKIWIAENFRSAKAVIEHDDKEGGTLIGNGNIQYPCRGVECIAKSNWKVHFKMRVDVKDDKFRLAFTTLRMTAPPSYSTYGVSSGGLDAPVRMQGDLNAIKPELLKFGDEIAASLSSFKKQDNW